MDQALQERALDERSPVNVFRSILMLSLGWLFTMVWCTGAVLFCVLTFRVFSRELVPPAAHTWSRVLLWLCGARIRKEGFEHIEGRAARVLIVNHPSTLDIVLGGLLLPAAGYPVAKREIYFYPFINLAWWALRFGTIDRSSPEAARRTLQDLVTEMREEKLSVLMAPEGTRSPDGEMHKFKKGAFHLAMQAGVPICPVVFAGPERVWPRGRLLPFPGEVLLRCLPPVDVSSWTAENLEAHIEEVRESMLRAVREFDAR